MTFVGNPKVKAIVEKMSHLKIFPHLLLVGPSGHGKTELARLIAAERHLLEVNANTLYDHNDLYAILKDLRPDSILFIDEAHSLQPALQESLYTVMDTFVFKRISGRGAQKKIESIDLPKFSIVAATTNESKLNTPFKNRFITLRLQPYTLEDLAELAKIKLPAADHKVHKIIADNSRGTPRTLINLIGYMKMTMNEKYYDEDNVTKALHEMEIYPKGLTPTEVRLLRLLKAGSLSLNSLACKMKLDEEVVAEEHEQYLVELGFIERGRHGREITSLGRTYLKSFESHHVHKEPQIQCEVL